jgi:hypothetical protein
MKEVDTCEHAEKRRDRSENPFVRNEQKIATDSPGKGWFIYS